ncbi:hypothetical protein EIN_274950 [Entamoeba invadens IP1]|uniref:Uncharacterized protein n=1 Tax=Entamoeba invadens IP1 TaxID=370355 RepID=A0A0A1U4U5_ENTIV|nr:hypothetical protein EIN_274950 [Entamoeba invadens IP1]ELP87908.1 hypothetical protein EIN_274950 [Entamoeba invadens IP1]|eukprot:XP_004254679.1 hypothetical protein EIN_274950 [Entamoeba invadens IP1]
MSVLQSLPSYYQRSFYLKTVSQTPLTVPLFTPLLIPKVNMKPSNPVILSDDNTFEDSSADIVETPCDFVEFENTCDIVKSIITSTLLDLKTPKDTPSKISDEKSKTTESSFVQPYAPNDSNSLEELENEIKCDLTKKHDTKDKKTKRTKKIDDKRTHVIKKKKHYTRQEPCSSRFTDIAKLVTVFGMIFICLGLIWKSHTDMLTL